MRSCDDLRVADQEEDPFSGSIRDSLRSVDRVVSQTMVNVGSAPRSVPGRGFSVDPERAQVCIDRLRGVVRDLQAAELVCYQARMVEPPGDDRVSDNVAVQSWIMADRALAFVQAWKAQVRATADGLEQQLRDYVRTDEEAAGRA